MEEGNIGGSGTVQDEVLSLADYAPATIRRQNIAQAYEVSMLKGLMQRSMSNAPLLLSRTFWKCAKYFGIRLARKSLERSIAASFCSS